MKHEQKEELIWLATAVSAGVLAGILTRSALKKGWEHTTGEPAPGTKNAPQAPLRQSVVWAAVSGLAVGVVKVLSQRAVASGWKAVKHDDPPTESS